MKIPTLHQHCFSVILEESKNWPYVNTLVNFVFFSVLRSNLITLSLGDSNLSVAGGSWKS